MIPPAALLSWDTAFFGVRIARAAGGQLDQTAADALVAWARAERIACLYVFTDADDTESPVALARLGALLVDVRLTLRASLVGLSVVSPVAVRPATATDLAALEEIAGAAHRDSRFYADCRFPRERADALYRAWIRGALERGEHVVTIDHGGVPVGYVTWSPGSDGQTARIGLVAVAEGARGRGAASAMIDAALVGMIQGGARAALVGTQARNLGAQRLYQRRGFLAHSAELVHHLWLAP